MSRESRARAWLCGAAAVMLLGAGCGLDGGIEPLESAIEGQITFAGIPPDSLVELRVAAFATYDPATFKITDLTAWSDPFPLDHSPVEYHFALPPGRYELILLAGRYAGSGWTPLAQYNPSQQSMPQQVTLPNRTSVVKGVDFSLRFTGATSGIAGRLLFINAWPDTVSSLRVGALRARMTDPKDPPITFEDIEHLTREYTRDDTAIVVTPTETTLDYRIELPPDTYRTVGVAWMAYHADGTPESWKDIADIFKLRGGQRAVLGVFNDDGSLVPDSVVVEPNLWVTGVDILVDFSRTKL